VKENIEVLLFFFFKFENFKIKYFFWQTGISWKFPVIWCLFENLKRMSKTQKRGRTEGSLILKIRKNWRLLKISKITHKHWWKLRTHHIIFQLIKATKYLVSKNRWKPPSPHSCVKYITPWTDPTQNGEGTRGG
jgi:hypothetical protein